MTDRLRSGLLALVVGLVLVLAITGCVSSSRAAETVSTSPAGGSSAATGGAGATSDPVASGNGPVGASAACHLLAAPDFAKAGVTATVGGELNMTGMDTMGGGPSSACQWTLDLADEAAGSDQAITVSLTVAPHATAADFAAQATQIAYGTHLPSVGVGDQSVYSDAPDPDDPGGIPDLDVLVRAGTTMFQVGSTKSVIIDEAELVALARVVVARL